MPYRNRELIAARDLLEAEIFRLKALQRVPGRAADATRIREQITELNRDRVALCATIVHRRLEASKDVVSLSRWVSGNGALDVVHRMRSLPARDAALLPSSRTSTPVGSIEAFPGLSAAD
ncbi:MAG TPA: hypothetical protein VMU69_28770 [Bradyrhizobium sp.]|nr:hypothetical protein [Stellaceae bacterium]HUO00218.1 hypothetical protein [Bradyrhizobium sp.]